jgi:hypothetical protein
MKLRYNPFRIILNQGDEYAILTCLEFFDLKDSSLAHACLLKMIKKQNPNGAFPSNLDTNHWGMQETMRNTLLAIRVGLPIDCLNVQSVVNFVLNHQQPDGGWCENPYLDIPPEQTWLSNRRSMTWLTADVVEFLRQCGMAETPEYQTGLEWLKEAQNQDGGWSSLSQENKDNQGAISDPDATAQISFLFGEFNGEDDPVYLRGKKLFEHYFEECVQDVQRGYQIRLSDGKKEELEVYHLTHLLLSWPLDPPRRFQAGYTISDPRVKLMMNALIDHQQEDGGWRPFWATESSPIYTVIAIKVLVLSGMLEKEGLLKSLLREIAS